MEVCVEVYKRGISNGACCTPVLQKAFADDVARGDTLDDLQAWLKRNPEVGRLDALRQSEQRELFLLSCIFTLVRVKTVSAEDSTKTQSGRRELNLFPTAEKCLEKIGCEQQENKKFYGTAYKNKDGYVFTWEDGTLYNPDYVSKLFTKAMIRFGRPEISLHKLRHSCVSMQINRGWEIKKLQYWLGHSDAQTALNIYSHFNRRRLNSSENDLSEISLASAGLF